MKSYKVYTIHWDKLAVWLLAKVYRKEKIAILLKAMLYAVGQVHSSFLTYRKAKIYQLTITPQVCYLERMLNDRYDSSLRRIYISDAVWHLPLFVYMEAENKPVPVYQTSEAKPVTVWTEGESGVALNDFVVFVPIGLQYNSAEMRSLIDSYKLFGTKYTIQLF